MKQLFGLQTFAGALLQFLCSCSLSGLQFVKSRFESLQFIPQLFGVQFARAKFIPKLFGFRFALARICIPLALFLFKKLCCRGACVSSKIGTM